MKLIDADKLIEHITNTADLGGWIGEALQQIKQVAIKYINLAPSIDIVRCGECKKLRDCRHDSWQKGVIEMGYVGWCERTSRLGDVTYVKDSDFCSYGKREGE